MAFSVSYVHTSAAVSLRFGENWTVNGIGHGQKQIKNARIGPWLTHEHDKGIHTAYAVTPLAIGSWGRI